MPRMKRVLFGEQSWISKQENRKGWWFFKYIYLVQYDDILEQKIDDYLHEFFETQNIKDKQVTKENYDDFKDYIDNFNKNTLEESDYLQTIIYHNWLEEEKYIYLNWAVILQANKWNYIKIINKEWYKELINYLKNVNKKEKYYLLEKDYKNLLQLNPEIKDKVFIL